MISNALNPLTDMKLAAVNQLLNEVQEYMCARQKECKTYASRYREGQRETHKERGGIVYIYIYIYINWVYYSDARFSTHIHVWWKLQTNGTNI